MSKIEWTDTTWNPVTGCDKISAGCQNCYAETMSKRLKGMGQEKYRNEFKVICHPEELKRDFGKKPKKIFVCSMGDLFHKDVEFEFIQKIYNVILKNPQHIFQILTKRPATMFSFSSWLTNKPFQTSIIEWPSNAWLGVTAENWETFEERSWYLNEIPADVKFISMEPLLDDISQRNPKDFKYYLSHFDWVIVGAETGPKARPMSIDWARSIMLQCQILKIPFFFKKVSKGESIPLDLNVRQFPKF